MVCKRIIPCLDVKDGRVVKGVRFEDLKDVGDPAELAFRYEDQGADEVVFLDISASKEGRATMLKVVQRTAESLFIPLTVGGGVSTRDEMHNVLRHGADKVSVNTGAVRDPGMVTACADEFGRQCVVGAVDAKREGRSWRVFTHGGSRATGLDAIAWCEELADLGAGEILLTSMDADGTTEGYDLDLTRAVVERVHVPVIASGGVGGLQHLADGLQKAGADAALAASIFHYGTHTVREAKAFLARQGVDVRPVA